MKYLFITLLAFILSGCAMGTKIKEYGGGVSNIQHPVAFGVGLGLYKLGQSLEDKPEEIDTTAQVYEKEDLEVKFEE